MRKIVQISISAVPAVQGEHSWWECLFALCDDGTVWVKDCPSWVGDEEKPWKPVKNVPQDDSINF